MLRFALPFCLLCSILVVSCTTTGYNHTSIPNVPYLNIDTHKHSHSLTATDRVCVFNGGDMITDTGTRYQNSGRFMQKIFVTTLQQYSLEGAVDMSYINAEGLDQFAVQDSARGNGCNLIAFVKPIFWKDSQLTPGNVGLNVDMYDTSSLELQNSVTLNARSNLISDMFKKDSPLKPVIETYVDELFK